MSDYIQQIQAMFNPYNIDLLVRGIEATVEIAILTILISFSLGALLGIVSASNKKILKSLVSVYVDFFRNIPVLLIIMAVRFFVPLPWLWPAIFGLSIYTTAIISEVVRAGIQSIPRTQYEAARSQGFNQIQVMRYVILPQALRNVLPPLVSQSITVLKDTSFAAGVSILPMELTGAYKTILGMFGQPAQVITMSFIVAGIYFIIDFTISFLARRIKQPGQQITNKNRRFFGKSVQVAGNPDYRALDTRPKRVELPREGLDELESEVENYSDETTPTMGDQL